MKNDHTPNAEYTIGDLLGEAASAFRSAGEAIDRFATKMNTKSNDTGKSRVDTMHDILRGLRSSGESAMFYCDGQHVHTSPMRVMDIGKECVLLQSSDSEGDSRHPIRKYVRIDKISIIEG